jgi:hypothetical protein
MYTQPLLRRALCLVAIIGLMGITACSKDSEPLFGTGTDSGAPALPAVSTMTMDLSFFGVDGTTTAQARAQADGEMLVANAGIKENWINAVIRVLFVQLTLYDILEEPVGAFVAAAHSVPQKQDDGSYLWTFIFVEDGAEYSVFLYGKPNVDVVDWRLEVSTNIPEFLLDHFVWFEGQSRIDETSGYWQFYKPVLTTSALAVAGAATDGEPVIRMDWENLGGGHERLTVLVNEIGGEDENDRLEFNASPNAHSIDYHDADVLEDHNITWYADGSGNLTVPDYNNGATACWDIHQDNIACP